MEIGSVLGRVGSGISKPKPKSENILQAQSSSSGRYKVTGLGRAGPDYFVSPAQNPPKFIMGLKIWAQTWPNPNL